MISVIVYTHNNEQTIEWCLQSLTAQRSKTGYEVIVIDDCSLDRTPEIVERKFPQFRLIKHPRMRGWVASLHQHLPSFRGDILAFLGAHCRAQKGWASSVEKEMGKGYKVVSGMGYYQLCVDGTYNIGACIDMFRRVLHTDSSFKKWYFETQFSEYVKAKSLCDDDVNVLKDIADELVCAVVEGFGDAATDTGDELTAYHISKILQNGDTHG